MVARTAYTQLNYSPLLLVGTLLGMTLVYLVSPVGAIVGGLTGNSFILGLGAVVGVVIVGQILYSSASDHVKEFGTLKAMGASDWVIYRVIVEQALWMAVLGYLPGMALCTGVAAWTAATQKTSPEIRFSPRQDKGFRFFFGDV